MSRLKYVAEMQPVYDGVTYRDYLAVKWASEHLEEVFELCADLGHFFAEQEVVKPWVVN